MIHATALGSWRPFPATALAMMALLRLACMTSNVLDSFKSPPVDMNP
jgi:hypothetical protein